MPRQLTEEQEAKLSMYMRVSEFLRKNETVFKENPAFVTEYEKMKANIPLILNELDEVELNMVLDRYKEELEFLRAEHKDVNI